MCSSAAWHRRARPIHGRTAADAPMLYLFFYKDMYAVQPWIKGFNVPAVFNGQRWTDVTISK